MPSLVGSAFYHGFHRPLGWLRETITAGGPVERWRTTRGRRAMEDAALKLPQLQSFAGTTPVVLQLLSGERFWYQTLFCLWTFSRHSNRNVRPVVFDDGTLNANQRSHIERVFPFARIVDAADAQEQFCVHLPPDRFPFLHDRWTHYPNIRKLIAPHLAASGWKLVIDSDLLFFRCPDFLLNWHDKPYAPLYATDIVTSYGYSKTLLEELAGKQLPELVNVGLCGLNSSHLDWERVEYWCKTLIEREGTHYFLEQALVALLTAGQKCAVAPSSEYVTLPQFPEVDECRAVMHHYVAESKVPYFRRNWRRASTL